MAALTYPEAHKKGRRFIGPDAAVNAFATNGSTTNATGDYSITPSTFKYQPATDTEVLVNRFIITITDVGAMTAGTYGALAALTNGVEVRIEDDSGTLFDMTAGELIKDNGSWGSFATTSTSATPARAQASYSCAGCSTGTLSRSY